jgi:hypothetical protein
MLYSISSAIEKEGDVRIQGIMVHVQVVVSPGIPKI